MPCILVLVFAACSSCSIGCTGVLALLACACSSLLVQQWLHGSTCYSTQQLLRKLASLLIAVVTATLSLWLRTCSCVLADLFCCHVVYAIMTMVMLAYLTCCWRKYDNSHAFACLVLLLRMRSCVAFVLLPRCYCCHQCGNGRIRVYSVCLFCCRCYREHNNGRARVSGA